MFDIGALRAAAVAGLSDRVRWQLEHLGPGTELAGLLDELDVERLSGYDLVSFVGAAERQAAWTQSRQHAAMRELARRRPAPVAPADPDHPAGRLPVGKCSEFTADEIAAELRISRWAAEDRLGLALALARLPGTAEALHRGDIDLVRARAVADAVVVLPDAEARAVEIRVLPRATEQTPAALRQSLRRAVLAADPAAARLRHERAQRTRAVRLVPLADGMAGVWSVLRADHALAYLEGITALAARARAPGDPRTLDQRRADVLADLGAQLLARDDLPRRHGRRPSLQVTLAATTALGLDDAPGELAGYGPIPAWLGRELAADATWRRILTDPADGTLVDYGTTVYEPPQGLRDLVVAKHRRCRGPGCRVPAERCDLDHVVEFPEGPTAEPNLGPLCRHDHRRKHESGWRVTRLADGTYVHSTPTGHVYFDRLDPVLEPEPPPAGTGPAARTVGESERPPPPGDSPPF